MDFLIPLFLFFLLFIYPDKRNYKKIFKILLLSKKGKLPALIAAGILKFYCGNFNISYI
ncbi:hypothetical protein Cst_c00370 [Thermoclostridium stercorarium subsp. stercorarium DSM 8532]|uniref:Uncharacterized protein n=1 Tax=Thermoclostridium stercorarium (strain ATCC 35414 / DSM 8532 / NCIMB 11754) TaxID=1121335 RepID=L7VK81_THES1|nr:hypothetical protein Cst_c00370 [Thermoclostridium stercorarium subsp. stercorarium DSM 8532]